MSEDGVDIFYQPRLIRLGKVHKYLGVNKNYFNRYIRPYVQEIRLSRQMIAFDRHDLDRWVDNYKKTCDEMRLTHCLKKSTTSIDKQFNEICEKIKKNHRGKK